MTYNQIIHQFKTIALANPFIERFGSGEITDVETISSINGLYPFCWIVPQEAIMGDNDFRYKFRVMVFDIDETDDSHQQEILSDTLQTLYDIVKTFKYDGNDDYTVEGSLTATPFTQRFSEYVCGWFCDIEVITDANNSPCNLPNM